MRNRTRRSDIMFKKPQAQGMEQARTALSKLCRGTCDGWACIPPKPMKS